MKGLYKKDSKYKHNGTGALPKGLFVFMALLGAILVWLIKLNHGGMLLSILVPVSFIFIYCGLAWKTNLFYIREDQIGDNAYYMGFLFTLASLAYALWRFQADQAMGSSDPATIIGSFGVALWSTIVGIALRVFFSQMRQDPQDIEKEARSKIAHTASILSADLYQASLTFNAYARGLQQSVEEAFVQMKEVSARTVSSLDELNKKIEKVEAPDSLINRKIDGIFSNLESATTKLNVLAGSQTQSVESLISSSTGLVDGVESLNAQIHTLKENTGIVNSGLDNMGKISELVRNLQNELATLSSGFSDLNHHQTKAVESITQHADALGHQLERSRKYTEETHESLSSLTKTLADNLQ